jgi:hypothetical protein
MKRAILALTFAAFALYAPAAQEPEAPAFIEFPSALGAYVNSFNSGGLSYQHWEGRLGYHVFAGGLYNPNPGSGNKLDYNLTGVGMYRVYGEDFVSWFSGLLYLFAEAGHRGIIQTFDTTVPGLGSGYNATFSLGFGIGIEAVIFRHLSFPFEFGYYGRYPWYIDFGFGGGFRYRY